MQGRPKLIALANQTIPPVARPAVDAARPNRALTGCSDAPTTNSLLDRAAMGPYEPIGNNLHTVGGLRQCHALARQ